MRSTTYFLILALISLFACKNEAPEQKEKFNLSGMGSLGQQYAGAGGSNTESAIIFVKAGATGDGSSWDNPLGNLQAALQEVLPHQSIWVAAGTYLPTNDNNRDSSFRIPSDISLYGGFAGYESSLEERDLSQNTSVLSGEIGEEGNDDNSYTIVKLEGVSDKTLIDGFTIKGGNANNNTKKERNPLSSGGALLNIGNEIASLPTIKNCVFEENYAYFGGAIYNDGFNGVTTITIEECIFKNNTGQYYGGAIYNNGSNGRSGLSISASKFDNNNANFGAAIINQARGDGRALSNINNSTFNGNVASTKGSPFLDSRSDNGRSNTFTYGCLYAENKEAINSSSNIQHKKPVVRPSKE